MLTFATRLQAQKTFTVDLGSARIRYADSLNATAFTISPALQLSSARAGLQASGSVSQLGSAGWTAQGLFDGTLYSPGLGPLLGELDLSVGGSAHRDGYRTAQLLGLGRLHLAQTHNGVWLGAGAGSNWDGDVWRNVRQAEAGAWLSRRGASATLVFAPTIVDDSIRYYDSVVSLSLPLRSLELSAQAGYRAGDELPMRGLGGRTWASVSAASWVLPWAALVAGVGTYPVDLTQGFPGGRFITLGVRMRQRSQQSQPVVTAVAAPLGNDASAHEAPALLEFQSRAVAHGEITLRVRATQAENVEIAGDFTNWKPAQFVAAADGWWSVTLLVTAGTHQLNVRINGGKWLVPPGLPAVTDEFGGQVGILTVAR